MTEKVLSGDGRPPAVQEPETAVNSATIEDDRGLVMQILDAQHDLIHDQIKELQRVVILQCRMTGTNALAQEMAVAVLGKKSGKKSGESLTPKALNYLYNVFSIKDTITKKEARELSALCGATVTQVREFFAGQRSQVRRFVQIYHDDLGSSSTEVGTCGLNVKSFELDSSSLEALQGQESGSTPQPVDSETPSMEFSNFFKCKVELNLKKSSGIEMAEKLLNLMHKENTFVGQNEIVQALLQAHVSVLRGLMVRGGLQQMTKWLVQAVAEEQTSLIRLILKVIAQLPLGSAIHMQMSTLLHIVNKLRFYRVQDVASRARLLLSRWSRLLKGNYSGRALPYTASTGVMQKRSRREADSDSSKQNDADTTKKKSKVELQRSVKEADCGTLPADESPQHQSEPLETPPETNTTKKRPGPSLLQGNRIKEKRKVQLFEESRAASRRKEFEIPRLSNFDTVSRPLSADDIKKAKRRAYFLQISHKPLDATSNMPLTDPMGGVSSSVDGKLENGLNALELPKIGLVRRPKIKIEGWRKANVPGKGTHFGKQDVSSVKTDNRGFNLIPWRLPERVDLDPRWSVASGHESIEISLQSMRIKNEQEILYTSFDSTPSNPLEPLERGSLFVDDSLVPEILLETVEEDNQEKGGSLPSPRDLNVEKTKEEADCKLLGEPCNSNDPDKKVGVSAMIAKSYVGNIDISEFTAMTCLASLHPEGEAVSSLQVAAVKTTTSAVTSFSLQEQKAFSIGKKCVEHDNNVMKELEHVKNEPLSMKFTQIKPVVLQGASASNPPFLAGCGPESFGMNLSELSKEACLDMLRVVLQQLAESSGGSGADLELLSIFLKNPDIVKVLTSSESSDLANSMRNLGVNVGSINHVFANSLVEMPIAKSIHDLPECSNGGDMLMASPAPHLGHMLPGLLHPRPPLPPGPPPFPSLVMTSTDQVGHTLQTAKDENTSNLCGPSSSRPPKEGHVDHSHMHYGLASASLNKASLNNPSQPVAVDAKGESPSVFCDYGRGASDHSQSDDHLSGRNVFPRLASAYFDGNFSNQGSAMQPQTALSEALQSRLTWQQQRLHWPSQTLEMVSGQPLLALHPQQPRLNVPLPRPPPSQFPQPQFPLIQQPQFPATQQPRLPLPSHPRLNPSPRPRLNPPPRPSVQHRFNPSTLRSPQPRSRRREH